LYIYSVWRKRIHAYMISFMSMQVQHPVLLFAVNDILSCNTICTCHIISRCVHTASLIIMIDVFTIFIKFIEQFLFLVKSRVGHGPLWHFFASKTLYSTMSVDWSN
jgi:hypothetical protein